MDLEERYTDQQAKLLPPGKAWARGPGSTLRRLLAGMAVEWARIHQRALDLLDEASPSRTTEMLPDWERFLGLPSDCAPSDITFNERRQAVVTKYTEVGGQSRPFFIDLAATLGFTIEITEYRPFVAGSRAGDALTNGDWIFRWDVHASADLVTEFRAGASAAGEPLRAFDRETQLECDITRRKPAHTIVRFVYDL